ncbi:replication-relaxation family protein [Actinomadura harenae]|nr:replication-relaxation family protein [Actinomadura harenae]
MVEAIGNGTGIRLGVRPGIRFDFRLGFRVAELWARAFAQVSDPQEPNDQPTLPTVSRPLPHSSSSPSPQPPNSPHSARPPLPPSQLIRRANWLDARFTPRDWAIIETLYRMNCATGRQIQRLHFAELASAQRSAQYVLRRLIQWRAVVADGGAVGGILRGSAQRIISLDPAAYRLMRMREGLPVSEIRSGESPTANWLNWHGILVTELYVQCREAETAGTLGLIDFTTEPRCWWPNGTGGFIRPDAYVKVDVPRTDLFHDWWIEVDTGTESIPRVREKFTRYLDYAQRGATGPNGHMPRVLLATLDHSRVPVLRRAVTRMGPTAQHLIQVMPFRDSAALLAAFAGTPATPAPEERQ